MKVIDKVTPEKAEWAADQFIDYFKNFSSIEDYLSCLLYTSPSPRDED